MKQAQKQMNNVISALTARAQFEQILKRASEQDERFVVDRRGQRGGSTGEAREANRSIIRVVVDTNVVMCVSAEVLAELGSLPDVEGYVVKERCRRCGTAC